MTLEKENKLKEDVIKSESSKSEKVIKSEKNTNPKNCLLYTSDAADE